MNRYKRNPNPISAFRTTGTRHCLGLFSNIYSDRDLLQHSFRDSSQVTFRNFSKDSLRLLSGIPSGILLMIPIDRFTPEFFQERLHWFYLKSLLGFNSGFLQSFLSRLFQGVWRFSIGKLKFTKTRRFKKNVSGNTLGFFEYFYGDSFRIFSEILQEICLGIIPRISSGILLGISYCFLPRFLIGICLGFLLFFVWDPWFH